MFWKTTQVVANSTVVILCACNDGIAVAKVSDG